MFCLNVLSVTMEWQMSSFHLHCASPKYYCICDIFQLHTFIVVYHEMLGWRSWKY